MNVIINSTIEFNNKLMKALCESDDDDDENNKDVCLISGEKLETTPIQLECKHMYNYGAILDEVKNQKKFSALEINRLKTSNKMPLLSTHTNGYSALERRVSKSK